MTQRNAARRRLRDAPLFLDFAGHQTQRGLSAITYSGGANGTYFGPDGVLRTSGTDVPRFDHDPVSGVPLGLLIEAARTNVCLQSEAFGTTWDNTTWNGGTTLTENDATAPDGTATADKTVNVDANNDGIFQTITLSTATEYAQSVFLKNDDSTLSRIFILRNTDNATVASLTIAWTAGVPSTSASSGASNITYTNAGSSWYRVSFTFTSDASVAGVKYLFYPNHADGTPAGLWIWGAQLEVGAFPSSYIKTTTLAVERTADAATMAVTLIPSFSQTKGVIYVEGSFPAADAAANTLLTIDDGGATDRVLLERDADENINFATTHSADTNGASDGAAVIAVNTLFKVAAAFADDDVIACVNGTLSAADATAAFPLGDNMTTVRVGADSAGAHWAGHIKRIAYWPQRLENEQLQALTS